MAQTLQSTGERRLLQRMKRFRNSVEIKTNGNIYIHFPLAVVLLLLILLLLFLLRFDPDDHDHNEPIT